MKTSAQIVHVSLAEALSKGPPPAGNLAVPIFSHGSLVVELYTPAGNDRQKPHTRDELYVVTRGKGDFFDGTQRQSVEAGSFLFVPAGHIHHFEDFSSDFAVWVAFYGPEGGESKLLAEASLLTIDTDDPAGETARRLIDELCTELSERYGAPPSPFSHSEAKAARTTFLVARLSGRPIGCGALRPIDDAMAEVKRMYVVPTARRKGIARRILVALERRAVDFGYRTIRLETGIRQPEAQRLYESLGYQRIAAFGPYADNPTSVCYEKSLPENARDC
jgi:putative acetyltransferase